MARSIRLFCIGSMLTMPSIVPAQVWVARYNGGANDLDSVAAIALDNSSNIYVTGCSEGGGADTTDYATVKYNPSGVEQWVVRYNGPGIVPYDCACAIAVDDSGNAHVTGRSKGAGTANDDYTTVKYNSSGVVQWVRRYNGPNNHYDGAKAIALDNSGNVYVTGYSAGPIDYDYATVKYNSSGVEQWVARYDGPDNGSDGAEDITVDNTGNVYVTGHSVQGGIGNYDYATVKYSSSGVEQWVARYDGPDNGPDNACAIVLDNSSNVYVTGYQNGTGSHHDYATVKYNSSGVEQWVAIYNGPSNGSDAACAIALDNSNNVYITGTSRGSGTSSDFATVKYSSSGVEQWVARYNGPGNMYDGARAIAIDNSGNVYITGWCWGNSGNYDYATMKYNSSGVEQWVAIYDGPGSGYDRANDIAIDNSGFIYVTGGSVGSGMNLDYATIKYSPTGILESRVTQIKSSPLLATIFHGPLQLPEGKKCRVFDIAGRVVEPTTIQPGIYFIKIDGVVTQKVVKVR
jgi:uncharacterized delta-60 repeat protein